MQRNKTAGDDKCMSRDGARIQKLEGLILIPLPSALLSSSSSSSSIFLFFSLHFSSFLHGSHGGRRG
jgi:hypothetical protein